jgi:hypothetical protein
MKKTLNLLAIVIMALLSLFIFIAEVTAQPMSDNQEILLCIKYQPDETIFLPQLVVFKPRFDTLLETTSEPIQGKNTSNSKAEKDDTLF